MTPGTIVVVTGTTGSGKSTTCRTFVDRAPDLWLHFGVDTFLGTIVPRKFVDGGPRCHEGLHMAPDDPVDPDGTAHMELGEAGVAMIRTMHEMAATAAREGMNVIMDHVTTQRPPLLQDCVARLAGLPVLLVALVPPPALLVQRIEARLPEVEKILGAEHAARTNAGTKRASAYIAREIFANDRFDLRLDTSRLSPEQAADAILARLTEGPGTAFDELAAAL